MKSATFWESHPAVDSIKLTLKRTQTRTICKKSRNKRGEKTDKSDKPRIGAKHPIEKSVCKPTTPAHTYSPQATATSFSKPETVTQSVETFSPKDSGIDDCSPIHKTGSSEERSTSDASLRMPPIRIKIFKEPLEKHDRDNYICKVLPTPQQSTTSSLLNSNEATTKRDEDPYVFDDDPANDSPHLLPCKSTPQTRKQESRRDVDKDGNCLFRCLSLALEETETNHAKIRATIVSHMKHNQDYYAPFVDESFEIYIGKMSKTVGLREIWGAELELHAASRCFEICIQVTKISNEATMNTIYGEENEKMVKLILEQEHYNVVL